MDFGRLRETFARSMSLPVQAVLAVIAVATSVLGWVGIISRDWAGIGLIIVTAFWLNTVWELHKESQKTSTVATLRESAATASDEEARYALNLVEAKARFSPSASVPGARDYRFYAVIENTATFPIRIEVVTASVLINGHGQDASKTWTVSSHILQAGRSVEVSLPDVKEITWQDIQAGATCTGILRFQRPDYANYFRCEFDLTVTPDGYDTNGWPMDWNTALNREIDYGDWV